MPLPILGAMILSCIIYLAISWHKAKSIRTVDDYFLADKKLKSHGFLGAYGGTNITFTAVFLYLATEGATRGNVPLGIIFFWLIGVFLFWWFHPRISIFCETGHTLHEYLGNAFNSTRVRRLASFVTIVTFVAGVSFEFYGFAWLMEKLSGKGVPWIIIGLVLLMVMVAYTMYGGFPAVLATDIFQLILILLAVGALIWFSIIIPWDARTTVKVLNVNNFVASDLLSHLAYLLLFIPFQFAVMDTWQRCVAAGGDQRVIRPSMLWGGILVGVAFAVPIIIGISVSDEIVQQNLDSQHALLLALKRIPAGFWYGLVIVAFLASLFSTADTFLLNAAYSLVYDQQVGATDPSHTPESFGKSERLLPNLRFLVAILGVASLAIFWILFYVPLRDFIFAVMSAQAILGFLVLYHFRAGENAKLREPGAVYSIVAGFSAPIIFVLLGVILENKQLIAVAPVISIILALIIFRLFPKSRMDRVPQGSDT